MKRLIITLLLFTILFSVCAIADTGEAVTVKVNGVIVESDVPPVLKSGRTYLPLRAVLNAIGVENKNIIWWEISQSVEIRHNNIHIFMPLESHEVIVNDNSCYLDAPAFETQGRTLVPVRFLSENLNCIVEWDDITFTVNICTN